MKRLLYFLFCAIALWSCSKDDNEVIFTLSATELNYEVDGGEQIVDIKTNGKYDCSYNEDWILVRQSADKIKIIVDPNMTTLARTAILLLSCNGVNRQEICVKQDGIQLNIDASEYSVPYKSSELLIPITTNAKYVFVNNHNWMTISTVAEGLKIVIDRNYKMSNRSGQIVLQFGEVNKEITINQEASTWFDSFEMVKVEGGIFLIGAQKTNLNGDNFDPNAYAIEAPVHNVKVNSFLIGKYEVTQEQWEAAMGSNPSSIVSSQLPVEKVSWEDVKYFISVLNQTTGMYYRLPTEAEWEFAAKGGIKSYGYFYSGYSVIGACAWYYSNSNSTTHTVGTKDANELGIFDMTGNVREWCEDWFEYYPLGALDNPQGPSSGNMKINRGGSWTTPSVNCRNSYRHTDYPNESAKDLGFRLVLVLP